MFGFKAYVSFIVGALLLVMGLFPVLGFNPLSFLPAVVHIVLVLLAALWLAIDGFGEEHIFKTISIIFALIFGLIVAIPLIHSAGWLPFGLPNLVLAATTYLYVVGGGLLIVGPFVYQ